MRLANHPLLDALCGEYLVGTLRGPARRRFERALREEPRVELRLRYLQNLFAVRYSPMIEVEPSRDGWKRLERELGLSRYKTRWYQRLGLWQGLAASAIAVAALAIGLQFMRPSGPEPRKWVEIARMSNDAVQVTAGLTTDGQVFELRASRPVLAGPSQSYELWLLPASGEAPLSLAVLGSLDTKFAIRPELSARVRAGGRLAVSVEPAGGSPTGKPTGPVILAGALKV